MLQKVILHNSISLDGKNQGFTPDLGLHYGVSLGYKIDIHLVGSNTILSQQGEIPPETEDDFKPKENSGTGSGSRLVIPDSRGRIRSWHMLRKEPYWVDCTALCSKSTPKNYLDYLKERHIDYIITGRDKINFSDALEELNTRYEAKVILLDSGGTLNGVLLRAGLVSEISLLVHPLLVGGIETRSFFKDKSLNSHGENLTMKLIHVEKLKNDIVWLKYELVN